MKPGATARPAASIVLLAGPDNLPISTILPSLTPTSPRNDGMPEPSTTRPFLISRSYAIGFLLGRTAQMATRSGATVTRHHTATPAFAAWVAPELCVNGRRGPLGPGRRPPPVLAASAATLQPAGFSRLALRCLRRSQ